MKNKLTVITACCALTLGAAAQNNNKMENTNLDPAANADLPVVYFTTEITPQSLIDIFHALGVEPTGNVAVKISSGEGGNVNYLKPELIGKFVKEVNGTLVECCTAYEGTRLDPAVHYQTMVDHGFTAIAPCDIMDAEGEMIIPVSDKKHIQHDIVGNHLANYDFMVNLAHFKGHPMGGFGGVLKNASIGVASTNGKAYIHTAGKEVYRPDLWETLETSVDDFIESMASAAQGVHNYMNAKSTDGTPRVVYINVMNNMSVDCDCVGNGLAEEPKLKDMGIAASLDPVALDQACVDMVFNHHSTEGDDSAPLIERINRQHGTHILPYAESIGLGSRKYRLQSLK